MRPRWSGPDARVYENRRATRQICLIRESGDAGERGEHLRLRGGTHTNWVPAADLPPVSTLIGVAGTVTTVAAHVLNLSEYDRSRIHGARLTIADRLPLFARRCPTGRCTWRLACSTACTSDTNQ